MTEQEIALANAKGLETRRRRWEQRNEKKRLAALAAEEAARGPYHFQRLQPSECR